MTKLFAIASVFLAASFSSPVFASQSTPSDYDYEYQVTCEIELIGNQSGPQTEKKTTSISSALYGQNVHFDLGAYELSAGFYYSTAPQISMTLYKKIDGPIAGQVNYASAVNLNELEVGKSVTLKSLSFGDFTHNRKSFSRVDYTCSITRHK